ncbi:MAG: AtpZ/AtpI family protein [Planctomycetaceae bacterium]|nr:AtpZ/AtpI family protein [Planctomycetaceae bacterium]
MSAALSMAMCSGIGYWLDNKYGLSPWCTVGGACFGCWSAALALQKLLSRLDAESRAERRVSGKSTEKVDLD